MPYSIRSRTWGPLLAKPSSTTISFKRGCSRRIFSNNRRAALRSQSFLVLPSCF